MNPDELRTALDHWANSDPRPGLAVLPSDCACERASSPKGSPGQVADEESLLYFVTSKHSIDLSKRKRTVRRGSLKNVFDKGLSTVRLAHSDDDEIIRSAAEVAHTPKERDGEFGGIVLTVLVGCSSLRHLEEGQYFCVYETPADPKAEGGFRRPCHADIASATVVEDEAEKTAILGVLFNVMIENGHRTCVFDFMDGMLAEHSPDCLKRERTAQ
jgi:hypothetical protein